MDAFEELVAACVASEGHWVQTKFKVDLDRTDKIAIETSTAPRWELDIVAYSPRENVLRVIECKSFFDSHGVDPSHLDPAHKYAKRYKLFIRPNHWPIISARLHRQLCDAGLIRENTTLELYLAFGKVRNLESLEAIAARGGWKLIKPDWVRWKLKQLSGGGWENTTAAIVAKLLLRDDFDFSLLQASPFASLPHEPA